MERTSTFIDKSTIPLVVDLDGTLIKTDTLYESVLLAIKNQPWIIFQLFAWLFHGLSFFKHRIAALVMLDIESLPYNEDVLLFLRNEYGNGRKLVLASASNQRYVQAVANHLGIFSEVLASDEKQNYKGMHKAEKLIELYSVKGFDYIGDSRADLKIFPSAREVFLVNPTKRTGDVAVKNGNVKEIFKSKRSLKDYLKLIRVHQWLKNTLVFLPLMTSHNWFDMKLVVLCFFGFVALSVGASGTYVLNDLFDLHDDRKHPRKKTRPIAAGSIPIVNGIIVSITMMASGLIFSWFLGVHFFLAVLFYYLVTFSYSFIFKNYVLIDSILLASLFTIRVIAGATLIDVKISFWLLAFSIFFFFSLALIKRCTELQLLQGMGRKASEGRDYNTADLVTLRSIGITSGLMSIVVFALYINSDAVGQLYAHAEYLWLACPALLYLVCRLWVKTGRNEMHDDPIIFALKDKGSLLMFMLIVALIVIATYL